MESEISAGNEAADGDQIVVSVEELKAIECRAAAGQGRADPGGLGLRGGGRG